MDLYGIEPSAAKRGALVLVFGKIVWLADAALFAALQSANVVTPFKFVGRALNTKVLVLPWNVPATSSEAAAQRAALQTHSGIHEARGFAMPELAADFRDDSDDVVPYMDGGELVVAMARVAPDRIGEAMPYLRLPQRQDWFMDALATVADGAKGKARTLVYDAIVGMPIPPASNRYRKTYEHAVTAALEGYRALKDDAATKRLEDKARIFAKAPRAPAKPAKPAKKPKRKK